MPSGRTHNFINMTVYTLGGAATIWGQYGGLWNVTQPQMLWFSLGFLAGTFLLSPDLDLAEGRVNSKNNWGLLGPLWVPYGMLFSHRGISHTWVLGPLTRLGYLAVLAFTGVGLLRTFCPEVVLPTIPQPFEWKLLLPVALGYFLSQWLHLLADGIRPGHSFRRARFGKRRGNRHSRNRHSKGKRRKTGRR